MKPLESDPNHFSAKSFSQTESDEGSDLELPKDLTVKRRQTHLQPKGEALHPEDLKTPVKLREV